MSDRKFRHEILVKVTLDTDASPDGPRSHAIADDIRDTLSDVVGGFIGDPDQHAIYGAAGLSVSVVK